MTSDNGTGRPQLNPKKLKRGGVLLFLSLILSAWVGLFIGIFILGVSGGLAAAGGFMTGLVVVPLWGVAMAQLGLSRSRDAMIRAKGAQILGPEDKLHQMVAMLTKHFEIPMPMVGLYQDAEVNAFASGSGPQKAIVCFSTALLDKLTVRQMIAVAAHELSHIANNDMRRMQFASSFQNGLTWYLGWTDRGQAFARWFLGFVGEVMVLRLSRSREYWADATAAAVIGKEAMIEALEALDRDPAQPSKDDAVYARMMIRPNPANWLSTHPTIAQRIEALEKETFMRRLSFMPAKRIAE